MKKIILFIAGLLPIIYSCSDMLDVDDKRAIEMPELNQKTDSLFYVAGIMQAMQQAADSYVLLNEMRGDLVTTTSYSDENLKKLATFSRSTTKYDSAYVFYRVINNCNYYLAHRDTALYDGSYNVTLNEYAAVLSFRAWAYLQLARNYKTVKFYTHPLTSLTQIENDNSPMLDIRGITAELEGELKKFSGADITIPYGGTVTNDIWWARCCIPVNVILGELYLESGRYQDAAECYFNFLVNNELRAPNLRSDFDIPYDRSSDFIYPDGLKPEIVSTENNWYLKTFNSYSTTLTDLSGRISVISMADNSLDGITTEVPRLFGTNVYTTTKTEDSVYIDDIQIVPSEPYKLLADTSYYYYTHSSNSDMKLYVNAGDMRARAREYSILRDGQRRTYIQTYYNKEIHLYHTTTIWLHLAEAFNRMGYPDAAFAILKEGITDNLMNRSYISEATKKMLTTAPLAFCSTPEQIAMGMRNPASLIFSGTGTERNFGIHRHGCSDNNGLVDGVYESPYSFDAVVGQKLAYIQDTYGVTPAGTKADIINAVEELLCDEYAMEFAFEGTRFADLARLARNKNNDADMPYGANFGSKWLSKKLEYKNPEVSLLDENNWYRPNPFK